MDSINQLRFWDYAVIVFILVSLVTIGMLRGRKLHGDIDFFLAGRSVRWPMIGFSIFASNISAEHLVGLAGAGYMYGLLHGNYEWMAAGPLLMLALIFAPYYLSTRVSTMPEFLERRFNRACRDFLGWLNVITTIFIRLGVALYAGGLVIRVFLGWPLWLSILVLSLLAASYTIVGGLAAVIVTESFSANIMIAGSALLTLIGISKVGGIGELVARVPAEFWSMLRPAGDPEMPWYAIIFGYPVLGIWYWCTDQLMVQRVLGARDLKNGQLGVIFAGFLKLLPVFIFVLPGVIAFALYPNLSNGDLAYPTIISNWLPTGLRGVMVAVLIVALLSTIDAGLNSISTIFALDIFRKWMPDSSHERLLLIGRLATAGAMLLAVVWSPMIGRFPKGIFIAINQLIAAIAPPLTAVFLMGVLWKRTTPRAAELALWIGEPVTVAVGLANVLGWPAGFWPHWMNFMFLAFVMLLVIMLFMAAVSLFTRPTAPDKALPTLSGLNRAGSGRVVYVLAGCLLALIVGLYSIFG
ncbi:sodium:solute symporter [bacterium]|nr:sodium:solute symporter [bacterium]